MKAWFLGLLSFLRLVDRDSGDLSLTNIALVVLLGKLCTLRAVELPDLAAFFLALLAYSVKRQSNAKAFRVAAQVPLEAAASGAADVLVGLEKKVRDLEAFVGSVKLGSRR